MITRRSATRWIKLSVLLAGLERGVEALARLDAHRDPPAHGPPRRGRPSTRSQSGLLALDARMRLLEQRLEHELDLLTAERLTVDLAEKQRRP